MIDERAALELVAKRWMTFWQGGSLDDFDGVHAAEFVDHSAVERQPNRDGFRQGVVDLYRAFPDFMATIDVLAVDTAQSLVTVRWRATGHMLDAFMGTPATGRRVLFAGIELIRVSSGKVNERWGEWDEGSLIAQIR